jgi:hypothetical protein
MAALYDEITTGPLAAELAPLIQAGDDVSIVAALNRKDIPAKGKLSSQDIKQYLSLIGLRLPILDSVAPACREASLALEDFESFDLSNALILSKFTDILDGLVAEALIPDFTETHKATILFLANKTISRAEQLNIDCSIQAIATALRG